MNRAYDELIERTRQAHLLQSTAEVLGWDQETMMPPGGVEHRSRQLALLARLTHERRTDPDVADLLDRCAETVEPDSAQAANVREIRRDHQRLVRVPAALVAELAETQSRAQHEWAEAREASDFARFLPWLDKLVRLCREKAGCLGVPDGGEAWDALAEDFEPGMRARDLQALFAPLRERLVALIDELRGTGVPGGARSTPPDDAFHRAKLPSHAQEAFVRFVVERMGFDFTRGRLDRATHPFCSGSHGGDVRITTRFHDDNVGDALGSTMHEAGHGIYEQGLPGDHVGTPLGEAVSLGVHESQSRLWENQVGRSRAFWGWAHPRLADFFGDALRALDAEQIYRTVNRVEPSLIRVEADEATYNLHVMLRFEIELALVRGDLAPADVPGVWNEKYREFLGVEVPDDRRGCLQDVHWSCGLFGYFPTYTLGNLYAAQLFAAAQRAIPDLTAHIGRGEFDALRQWLNENVHAHGRRYPAAELCERATGEPLSPEPFLRYLSTKLRDVYR